MLARFLELSRVHGFAFVVVFVSGPHVRFDDDMRRRWLAAWSAGAGVPLLDLAHAFTSRGRSELYLPNDAHWNASGHRVAAEALAPFLADVLRAR